MQRQKNMADQLWLATDFSKNRVAGWDRLHQEYIIKRPDGKVLPHRPKKAKVANNLIRQELQRHNAAVREARKAEEV